MINADAYGHGLLAVARALEQADAFAVSRLQEALELRRAGIHKSYQLLTSVHRRVTLDTLKMRR
jgi:alanine racemase